jgi:ketopantoate hydroxymethyltransferase
MLTAYDFTMAKIVDDTAGIDVILVGDSASNVMAGHETTHHNSRPNDLSRILSGKSNRKGIGCCRFAFEVSI